MTPAEIERKVRQLDNDVQSIYGMLAEISITQRRQGNRLNEMDGKLDEMDGKLSSMDGKLNSMDGKLNSMDGKLNSMDGKLNSMLDLLRGDRPVDGQ
ncbi:MAG: hypothetical protein ACRDZ4_05690 [Egibacteraceae bacterium]